MHTWLHCSYFSYLVIPGQRCFPLHSLRCARASSPRSTSCSPGSARRPWSPVSTGPTPRSTEYSRHPSLVWTGCGKGHIFHTNNLSCPLFSSVSGNMLRVGLLPPTPGCTVVELGAGKGYLSLMLADCFGRQEQGSETGNTSSSAMASSATNQRSQLLGSDAGPPATEPLGSKASGLGAGRQRVQE